MFMRSRTVDRMQGRAEEDGAPRPMKRISFSQRENEKTRSIYAKRIVKNVSPLQMKQKEKHKGDAKAATQNFHGHAGKVCEGCGSAPAYFIASIAFESARSAQKVFEMCLRPHHLIQKGKQKGCAFEKCTTQVSTGAAPRPLEWSPAPQGRDLTARSARTE